MSSDVLRIALNGLKTYQQALATTGHNIDNIGKKGYSRQVTQIESLPGSFEGGFFLGSGVTVGNVSRTYNGFVTDEVRRATSNHGMLNEYKSLTERLDNLLSDANSGISEATQTFFQALHTLNDSPGSTSARSTFLSQANILINNYHKNAEQLQDLHSLVDLGIRNSVLEINQITASLARINTQVVSNDVASPDLLDERDNLITELSSLVQVTTVEQDDGAINVFIGSGQPAVIGSNAMPLTVSTSNEDAKKLIISFQSGVTNVDITQSIQGGSLSGILSFRDDVLVEAENQIGRLAIGVADTFNAQHKLGLDLNGALGQNFFGDINASPLVSQRALANNANVGTAALDVTITNSSALLASDYDLRMNGPGSFTLTRLSDNTVTNFAAFPVSVDGIQISVASGTMNTGDRFSIQPTRSGAKDISLNITSPSQIALASPINTTASNTNLGNGQISPGVVFDTTNPIFATPNQLSPPLRIVFLSATSYEIQNANSSAVIEGPIAFNPNQTNQLFPTPGAFDPGFQVELSGAPVAGDTFNISYNAGGTGDNRNGLSLTDLQSKKTLANGTANYQDTFANLTAEIGLKTREAQINFDVNQNLLRQAESTQNNISGVNLDEEAADMLQFQQAYQASAELIKVASNLFNVLIDTFR